MKSKIAVLFLIFLLCLTSGCSNTSHIAEQPAPISSSGSNEAPDQAETAQATEKTEVEQRRRTEPKDDDHSAEATAGVPESGIQTKQVSEQPNSGTTPPQEGEPSKTSDESERQSEASAPSEKEQPTHPATEEPKPAEQLQPTEPPQEEPTEPAFDICTVTLSSTLFPLSMGSGAGIPRGLSSIRKLTASAKSTVSAQSRNLSVIPTQSI